jgi:ATP-dependent DNA ligase
VKHDGFRILAWKQGERVNVWSRRGADFTYRFPIIAEAVRSLSADEALIDGEAVVLRKDGRSDFGALMTKRGGAQASLVAFDLLRLNGDDLRLRPIEERRSALLKLASASTESCSAKRWPPRARSCSPRPVNWALKASCRSGRAASLGAGGAAIG